METGKTAIVIGATGLVGGALLHQLLADPAYSRVLSLGRRKTDLAHPKLVEHVIDFSKPAEWASLVKGDVLFSSLGTTRAQAGGVAAQRKVDYDYQYLMARTASANGVPTYVLVSSIGADANSSAAYMKMKGELDRDVQRLPFKAVHILRPGPLAGERKDPRMGERLALPVIEFFNRIGLFQKYRPILGEHVAKAMRHVAELPGKPAIIHEAQDLFAIVGA